MRQRRVVYARQGSGKVHVVDDIVDPRLGVIAWCGAVLHGDEYLARLVPSAERCNAPGCRVRWPAMLRAVG